MIRPSRPLARSAPVAPIPLVAVLLAATVLAGCEAARQPFSEPDVVVAPPRSDLGTVGDDPYFTPSLPGSDVRYR